MPNWPIILASFPLHLFSLLKAQQMLAYRGTRDQLGVNAISRNKICDRLLLSSIPSVTIKQMPIALIWYSMG